MHNIVTKASVGAMLGGALVFTAGTGLAGAQPQNPQDGLVNLTVGDVAILENVNTGVAATVAAAICGVEAVDGVDIDVLAEQLDDGDEGDTRTVCEVPGGTLTLAQNTGTPGHSGGAGNSENATTGGAAEAPGHTGQTPGQSAQTPGQGAATSGQSAETPGQSG